MKKQSNLSSLMDYAGGHRILTYLSWALSVISALLALVPLWYIWRIIHDILQASLNFSQAGNITSYGWYAVLFAVISIVVYIAALLCSHISAFRIAANIRKTLMRHITALQPKHILHTGCPIKRGQLLHLLVCSFYCLRSIGG